LRAAVHQRCWFFRLQIQQLRRWSN